MGLNKKSVNATAWGETGKFPIFIDCIRLCVNYFKRIVNLPDSNFAHAAIIEQMRLDLPWFTGIKKIIDTFDDLDPIHYRISAFSKTNGIYLSDLCSPIKIVNNIRDQFINNWYNSIQTFSKLDFYKDLKSDFKWEPYLDTIHSFNSRRSTSRIRCSSHRLHIETGRYTNVNRQDRICRFCFQTYSISTVESEAHILNTCPRGTTIREAYHHSLNKLNQKLNTDHDINIRSFNIGRTFPADLDSTNSPEVTKIRCSIIKLSCDTIHRLYRDTLRFNEDILKPCTSTAVANNGS